MPRAPCLVLGDYRLAVLERGAAISSACPSICPVASDAALRYNSRAPEGASMSVSDIR